MESEKKYPFENLVFEGGGVLGLAYQGAFEALEKKGGIVPNIKRVCGTSAGSISATMIALRYTACESYDVLMNAPFASFIKGSFFSHFNIFRNYGWYNGKNMESFFREIVRKKTKDGYTKFGELDDSKYLNLRIVATNLSKDVSFIFSKKHTPDVGIAHAMRISSAVPYFFASEKYKDDIWVDGGVLRNYAIDEFDEECENDFEKTLGFYLYDPEQTPRHINNILNFTSQFFKAMKNQQHTLLKKDELNCKRTVFIRDLGINALDFTIEPEKRTELIESGKADTEDFLHDWKEWEKT